MSDVDEGDAFDARRCGVNYDALRTLGETLADFALAGGMNDVDEARTFLADENIGDTLAEMFETWDLDSEERAMFGREYERGYVVDHARERVEFFASED